MNRMLLFIVASFPMLLCAQPQCTIDNLNSDRLVGIASGSATGFASGRIYITVTNGTRKYTTVTDRDGNWALSFADIDNHSEVLCWQEGNGLKAVATLNH